MGRFFDLYTKNPGKKMQIAQRASAYRGSLILGRNFNESTDAFFKRRPDLKKHYDDTGDDLRRMGF